MFIHQDSLANKGLNLMTQTISDSGDNKYHSHPFFEIFYITSNTIKHEVNGDKRVLSVGDIYFLRPGDTHTFHRERGNLCEHRDILLSAELVEKTCNFLDPTFFNALITSPQPFTFKLKHDDLHTLNEKLTAFSDLQASSFGIDLSAHENYLAVIILNTLLSELQDYHSRKYPAWVQDLIAKLNDNENFNNSLSEIIENIPYNKSYISRSFTKHVGMPISEYFIRSRVFFSVKLLKFTQMSISDIATSSGFATITYYNRVFKKQFGLSPMEYRRNSTLERAINKPKKANPPRKNNKNNV